VSEAVSVPVAPGRGRWREHAPLLVVVAVGGLVRLATMIAYRPAFEFVQDSFNYLYNADHLRPEVIRPIGYPVLLRLLSVADPHFRVVPIMQHLLGLAAGVLLYAVLRRLGAGRWLGAAGAAPLLLDGYQVAVEHFVLSETLFEALFVAAFALLLWRVSPGWLAAGASGLLLAAGTLTRTNGLVLLVPALGYLLLRRVRLPVVAVFLAAAALPLGGYATWFHAVHGKYGIVAYDGYFLTGRVSPFADCSHLMLTSAEKLLCDPRPVAHRPGPDFFVWSPASPLRRPQVPPGTDRDAVARSYARKVILAQPLDYLQAVGVDLLHYVAPGRSTALQDGPAKTLVFPTALRTGTFAPESSPRDPYVWAFTWPGKVVQNGRIPASHGFHDRQITPGQSLGLARSLRAYQSVVYGAGPALGLCVLLALLAAAYRFGSAPRRLVAGALLLGGSAVLIWLLPSATASFDYRYTLPTLALAPTGAVLGVLALRSPRPQADAGPVQAQR